MQSLKTRLFSLKNTIITFKIIKKISEISFTVPFIVFPSSLSSSCLFYGFILMY